MSEEWDLQFGKLLSEIIDKSGAGYQWTVARHNLKRFIRQTAPKPAAAPSQLAVAPVGVLEKLDRAASKIHKWAQLVGSCNPDKNAARKGELTKALNEFNFTVARANITELPPPSEWAKERITLTSSGLIEVKPSITSRVDRVQACLEIAAAAINTAALLRRRGIMDKVRDFGEPWVYSGWDVFSEEEGPVCVIQCRGDNVMAKFEPTLSDKGGDDINECMKRDYLTAARARRAIACVNALAGRDPDTVAVVDKAKLNALLEAATNVIREYDDSLYSNLDGDDVAMLTIDPLRTALAAFAPDTGTDAQAAEGDKS
jgi:hypothetical protein